MEPVKNLKSDSSDFEESARQALRTAPCLTDPFSTAVCRVAWKRHRENFKRSFALFDRKSDPAPIAWAVATLANQAFLRGLYRPQLDQR